MRIKYGLRESLFLAPKKSYFDNCSECPRFITHTRQLQNQILNKQKDWWSTRKHKATTCTNRIKVCYIIEPWPIIKWNFELKHDLRRHNTGIKILIGCGNMTKWSPIWSVIIRVITKSGDRAAGVQFVYHDSVYIGRHEVLLPINHQNYNFR